jgi:CCR4-NOT transcription complex subunit 7/8
MDTEFPGTVFPLENYTKNFYYKFIKLNVDKLNLIQLGITLFNEKGEMCSCWQFNFKFNLNNEKFSNQSISILSNSGIDFLNLKNKGIPYNLFAEYFIISGLVLNENIHWISFNGFSDFAYLLKLCLNDNLPENEDDFISYLDLYFPNYYDIKILSNLIDNLKGGLNKMAIQLNIERFGDMHQAGSDSIVTGEVFFKIKDLNLISNNDIFDLKNILFGIGKGSDDDETYQYTIFLSDIINGYNISNSNINGFNNVYYGNFYNNNINNFNVNNNEIFQFIQKKGSFDTNHYKNYPWNMFV